MLSALERLSFRLPLLFSFDLFLSPVTLPQFLSVFIYIPCEYCSFLRCPVMIEALRWSDPPSKESYRLS